MASLHTRVGEKMKRLASTVGHEASEKPDFRVQLQLPCPGSLQRSCEKLEHVWHCNKCYELIEVARDDDNYFYCACGKANKENFYFKCSSAQHGSQFTSFPAGEITKYLKPIRELNILVIGTSEEETPVWLNSFVNYIAFPETVDSSLHPITPFSFQITDRNDIVRDVSFGNETNSVDIRADVFAMGNTLVRLIDVPGIRVTTELENIDEQFRKTLMYLRDLKELHGVCILVKLDGHKLDVYFERCFKEFFSHFEFKILRNVVFCSVCARETACKTAKSRILLSKLLWKNKLDIALDKSRIYSMDNDTFRFFCAQNEGVEFDERDVKVSVQSWIASAEETKRLLMHFQSLQPHQIKDSMCVIEARNNIFNISKSIADILVNNQRNIQLINSQRDSWIKTSECSNASYKPPIYFKLQAISTTSLPYRQIVCANTKCATFDRRHTNKYSSICHAACSLGEILSGVSGEERIGDCSAMDDRFNCKVCGCFWECHQQIKFTQSLVTGCMSSLKGRSETSFVVDFANKFIDELLQEQQNIIKASVKIGCYLSQHALISYKNVMGQYIKLSMYGKSDIAPLQGMRDLYFKEYAEFQNLMAKSNAKEMNSVEFREVLTKLYALKYNGEQLKMLIEAASKCDEVKCEACEKFHGLSKVGKR